MAKPGAARETFRSSVFTVHPQQRSAAAYGPVAQLVQQASTCSSVIADELRVAGFEMLNDVVLNQVLVRWIDGPTTERLIRAVQEDGRIWCGPTQWQGASAMRISVSSWKTTVDDAHVAAVVIRELAVGLPPTS